MNDGKLISLLYNQEWDAVLQRLQKYPKEAKTPFFLHKQTIYPLHAACALPQVPLNVVKALCKADPEGPTRFSTFEKNSGYRSRSYSADTTCGTTDAETASTSCSSNSESMEGSSGWLPIMVAVYYGVDAEIVEFLLLQYPAAVTLKNGRGMLPLHLAVSSSSMLHTTERMVQTVQLLVNAFVESLYIPSSGRDGKTAFELVQDLKESSVPNKQELLQVVNPQSSGGGGSTTKDMTRVVQSILLETTSTSATGIPHIPLAMTLRSRSTSGTASTTALQEGNPSMLATKLVVALMNDDWDEAIKRLEKKPSEAQVWTLTTKSEDTVCHSLPLLIALRHKAPWNVVSRLLKEFPLATRMREFYCMLPLHVACQYGASLQVVQAIYQLNEEAVKVQDLSGMLPLHLACISEACRRDVILFLLDAYPQSLEIRDEKGMLAVDYVKNGKHPHVAILQEEFGRGLDYWAAPSDLVLVDHVLHRQWQQALARALSHPQEASVWTKHPIHGKRRFALHYACKYKAPPELVQALLEAHAEAAQVPIDDYHLLPLHLACSHGACDQVVKLLLETYIEAATIPDSLGLLPLHLAITEGASIAVIESLLEAYPNARKMADKKGFLPYVYAESSHHPSSAKVMKLLKDLSLNESSSSGDAARASTTTTTKHGRGGDAATSALLQIKRQKSDRSINSAKVSPIMVE